MSALQNEFLSSPRTRGSALCAVTFRAGDLLDCFGENEGRLGVLTSLGTNLNNHTVTQGESQTLGSGECVPSNDVFRFSALFRQPRSHVKPSLRVHGATFWFTLLVVHTSWANEWGPSCSGSQIRAKSELIGNSRELYFHTAVPIVM